MTQTCLSHKQRLLVAGTLFGMFFGAGNLIFPVHLGQLAGRQFLPAAIGFILTAVGIPILGVAAIGNTHSRGLQDLSRRVGHRYSYFFTCLLYLTIGPFFAIPRCATTSFTAGVRPLLGTQLFRTDYAVFVFADLLCAGVCIFHSSRQHHALDRKNHQSAVSSVSRRSDCDCPASSEHRGFSGNSRCLLSEWSFLFRALQGYETMDAIAGLAFGIVVISVIRQMGVREDSTIAKEVLHSGMLAGLLMAFIYLLTILIGVQSLGQLNFQKTAALPLPDCRLLPWTDGLLDPRHRDHIRLPQDLHRAL